MAVEVEDIRHVAKLPGPGEWRVNIAGHMIVLSSPYSGNYAIVGGQLYKLPSPWDGVSLGEPVHG
jgi:hypothetical protein